MIYFKGRHFKKMFIFMSIRWYVAYALSYRNIEESMVKPMMGFKEFQSAHATLIEIERHHMLRKHQHRDAANLTVFKQFYTLAA